MTKQTANRIARIITKAEQAGWTVTEERDGGMTFITVDDGYRRYMIGGSDSDGGHTSAVLMIGSHITHVTIRTVEREVTYAAAGATR
jgi:hypothetical protein